MAKVLVKVRIGDKVLYQGQVVRVLDYYLAPNSTLDSSLVALVFARKENGNVVEASADKFEILEDQTYQECYPSVEMSRFSS